MRKLRAFRWCLSLFLCACMLLPPLCHAEGEDGGPLKDFKLYHGDRNSKKIAITVDDCYRSAVSWIRRDIELCEQYGIRMTFFPVVYTGCLEEKYRDLWQSVIDSGCEIGTHSDEHTHIGERSNWGIIIALGKCQEQLDKTLGYHYQIRWFRPPYGSIADKQGSGESRVIKAIRIFGYEHVVLWDVSEMKDLNKALENIQNGSILLFHAKEADTRFLEKLIPELLERGFEPVTVSELFGFDPPETGDELYVFNKEMYKGK